MGMKGAAGVVSHMFDHGVPCLPCLTQIVLETQDEEMKKGA
jgi:hypothetical protein